MSSRLTYQFFLGRVSKCDLLPPPAQSRASPCPLALSIVWGNFQCLSHCSHFVFFGHLVAEFNCSHWKCFTSFTLEFPWLQLVAVACGPCTCEKGPVLPQLKLLTHMRKCKCGVQMWSSPAFPPFCFGQLSSYFAEVWWQKYREGLWNETCSHKHALSVTHLWKSFEKHRKCRWNSQLSSEEQYCHSVAAGDTEHVDLTFFFNFKLMSWRNLWSLWGQKDSYQELLEPASKILSSAWISRNISKVWDEPGLCFYKSNHPEIWSSWICTEVTSLQQSGSCGTSSGDEGERQIVDFKCCFAYWQLGEVLSHFFSPFWPLFFPVSLLKFW